MSQMGNKAEIQTFKSLGRIFQPATPVSFSRPLFQSATPARFSSKFSPPNQPATPTLQLLCCDFQAAIHGERVNKFRSGPLFYSDVIDLPWSKQICGELVHKWHTFSPKSVTLIVSSVWGIFLLRISRLNDIYTCCDCFNRLYCRLTLTDIEIYPSSPLSISRRCT